MSTCSSCFAFARREIRQPLVMMITEALQKDIDAMLNQESIFGEIDAARQSVLAAILMLDLKSMFEHLVALPIQQKFPNMFP